MMKQKSSGKILLAALGCILTVVLTMLAFVPFLNEILAVEVIQQQEPEVSSPQNPEKPEEIPVTVYYIMETESKKISELYIEVFPIGKESVAYLKLPVDTKVNLSEELYKSLQTYAPELPQHFKLSNMAEGFSKEYGLTGCNRILSEVIGMSFTEYVRTDAASFREWLELQEKETDASDFFEGYTEWLAGSFSSRTTEERWSYYESLQTVQQVIVEEAPGSREKDGFLISSKRSKERLEELMRWLESESVQEEN